MVEVDPARLLQCPVPRPGSDGAFEELFLGVDEAGALDPAFHDLLSQERATCPVGTAKEALSPACDQRVWRERAVIGVHSDVEFDLLDPSAWLHVSGAKESAMNEGWRSSLASTHS